MVLLLLLPSLQIIRARVIIIGENKKTFQNIFGVPKKRKNECDWLEKDQCESVISVQSLSCTRIVFVGRGQSFDERGYKSIKMERSAAFGKNREPTVIKMFSTDFANLLPNFPLVGANLSPTRLIPRLLLLIQPLNFIFYKILSVFNYMMTVDSLLARGRPPFHLSAFEAIFIKT